MTFRQRPDFTLTAVSGDLAALTGVLPAEWESQPGLFWQLVHEADAPWLRERIASLPAVNSQLPDPQPSTSCYRLRHRHTGRLAQVWEQRTIPPEADGTHSVTWVDVTPESIAERRLRDAAWKEALGVAVAGLAHDFNNVMAGVCSMSESLLAQLDAGHPFHDSLALIRKNSLESSRLLQQLVRWYRLPVAERGLHDLNQVVADLEGLLRRILSRRIEVHIELAAGGLPVFVDGGGLQRVILYLVVNALEAMPAGGRLLLRTARHAQPPAPSAGPDALPAPPMVSLSVEDSGAGIATGHLDDIFNPFFTTKPGRRGMGLGLHNATLFAAAHAGRITVESVSGQGCIVRLWLPEAALDEPASTHAALLTPHSAFSPAIVLTHPDRAALDAHAQALRDRGYAVAPLDSVQRALECLIAGDEDFAALVILAAALDDGQQELLAGLRRFQPSFKLVLQRSGDDADAGEPAPLARPDLVLASDLPASALAAELDALLGREPAAGE